jgi:hypothetical protein
MEALVIVANEPVVVAPWEGGATIRYHAEIWSAWLHGSVATVHNAGRVLLVVPVTTLTPPVVTLARRLYDVGSVTVLD